MMSLKKNNDFFYLLAWLFIQYFIVIASPVTEIKIILLVKKKLSTLQHGVLDIFGWKSDIE